jgi:hypothetical protein
MEFLKILPDVLSFLRHSCQLASVPNAIIAFQFLPLSFVEVTVYTFLGLAQDEPATPHEKEPTVLNTQDNRCIPENNATKT